MKEYSKLFEGQPASLNQIKAENELLGHTVEVLIAKKKLDGQRTLGLGEDKDIVLYPRKSIGIIPILIKEGVIRK